MQEQLLQLPATEYLWGSQGVLCLFQSCCWEHFGGKELYKFRPWSGRLQIILCVGLLIVVRLLGAPCWCQWRVDICGCSESGNMAK